jgi:hypothetical protein
VEYIRRKAFGLKDSFADMDEAEQWLFSVLEKLNNTRQTGTGKTAGEMFLTEKKVLGVLPPSRVVCAEQEKLRADKYATISYRTNRYSVPDHLVGQFVDVSIMSKELHMYSQNKKVAVHKRSFEKHHWIVDIEHYLSTFKQKPGALPGSYALASNVYLKELYQKYFQGEPRDFIELLDYCKTTMVNNEKLEGAVSRLLATGNGYINVEKLRALLGNKPGANNQTGDDKTYKMSKKQLSELTHLMHQTN